MAGSILDDHAFVMNPDGAAITGATSSTFSLVNAQPADAGSYAVRATNAGGTVTSAGVPVTVINLT
ncbi:MAG: hypothetical protein AAB217_25705, partial [Chloroflexota bacterium]